LKNKRVDYSGSEVLPSADDLYYDPDYPAERKRLQIEHTPHISDRAKMIKIADKICNIQDIIENPPSDWSAQRKRDYLDWSAKVVEGCRVCNPPLEHHFDQILQQGKQSIQKNY
jgi:guanosine-3',5'-bis(diphosphate) 3'-pyrophosphohydrolase